MAAIVSTGFALEPAEWRHRQALAIEQAGIVKFALPPATLDLARPNLEDLRLLDDGGREVPYLLERAAPASPPTVRAPRGFRVILEATRTEITIETGGTLPLASMQLATPGRNFLKAARVELSSDGNSWTTLATGVPLFRQSGAEQLELDLGRRAASHVRIIIDDTRQPPVPFTGATLHFVTTTQPPFTTPLPVRIAQREEFAGETLLTLDLGARNVPLAEFEIVTAEPLFARQVTLGMRELRDDVAVERTLAGGAIYRVAADGLVPAAHLKIPVDFTAPVREVFVHIANGDSPPLAIDEVRAQQRPIWLVFRAAAAGRYRLLTGNPDVSAPRYDLAQLAGSLREAAPMPFAPEPPELNPDYRRADPLAATSLHGAALDPAPWDFRKPVRVAAPGVQQLELDLDVLAGARAALADLRLLRDRTQIPYVLERPPLSRATTLAPVSRDDPKRPRFSRWELALPRAGAPLSQLTLASPTPLFQRHLRVFEIITDDRSRSYERTLAEATWSKTPGGERTLLLPLNAAPTTGSLMIETDNGDNPPIALEKIEARYPVARLLFKIDATNRTTDGAPAPLSLYYGNAKTAAPRYDLSLIAGQILAAEKTIATLGPEENARTGNWATAALASARGGPLFWAVLALVVVALLVVVARLLPKPPSN